MTKNYYGNKKSEKQSFERSNNSNRKISQNGRSNQEKKHSQFLNKNYKSKNGMILEGVVMGSGKNFLFCRVENMPDFFIPATKSKGAIDGDIILIKVLSNPRFSSGRLLDNNITTKNEQSTLAQVVKIKKRANSQLVGELVRIKDNIFFKPDNKKIGNLIKIEKRHLLDAKFGEKVVCKLTYQPENLKEQFQGEIIEILGDINSNEVLELSILREHNIYEFFPKEVIEFADKLSKKGISNEEKIGRLDLTKEKIFTIDGADAKDFDDAVSLKILNNGNYYLGVHIADVGHYVKRNNVLDKEAFLRGTSVYFPTMVFPMLPESLSNGICSLSENEERLTLSVFLEINPKGDVVNHEIKESYIKSVARLTYDEVYSVLISSKNAKETKAEKLKEILIQMNKLAKILKNKRVGLGELDLDISEPYFVLDANGEITDVKKRERNDAHRLIESFMIVCNEIVAKHFNKLKIPFVYRIHEKPTMEKLIALLDFLKGLGINTPPLPNIITPSFYAQLLKLIENHPIKENLNKMILRSLQKARYLDDCVGHFGLALEFYCHFTSPIRRYPDLVIHRIIKNFIKTNKSEKDLKDFVFEASEQSSLKEKSAEEAERDVDDLKRAQLMKKHIGEIFTGIISGVTNFGIFVELDNTVEGLIKIENLPQDYYLFYEKTLKLKGQKRTFSIGDRVDVKVVSSNVYERKIEFELVLPMINK